MSKIYITCPVTIATEEEKKKLETYVAFLEDDGHTVHYPARDVAQDESGFDICLENGAAIQEADEVHVFYNSTSKGSHFDLGVAFAFQILSCNHKTKFKMIEAKICDNGNGHEFVQLMQQWQSLRK